MNKILAIFSHNKIPGRKQFQVELNWRAIKLFDYLYLVSLSDNSDTVALKKYV